MGKLKGLDPGIAVAVQVLRSDDIETFESCEGGPGHAFAEPTVRFAGARDEGFRALAAVLRSYNRERIGMPLSALRRVWPVIDGEPTGPFWELAWWPRPQASRTPCTTSAEDHPDQT